MLLRIRLAATAFVLVATLTTPAHAMMEADKFIGAWRLVSAEFRTDDGELTESPYGDQPQGILMYDAQGTMSAQLAQKDRRAFAVADRMKGRPEEIKAAFETYQAYWGRYRIDERERKFWVRCRTAWPARACASAATRRKRATSARRKR